MTPVDVRDAAARLVARTCEAQGLPELIVDPSALARAAAFMVPTAAAARAIDRHIAQLRRRLS